MDGRTDERINLGGATVPPGLWCTYGNKTHSLSVGWRNLVRVSLIFVIIVSFMLFTVFPLIYVLYFEEFLIHDSRGFMILKKI